MQIKKNFTKSGLYILSSKLCKYANEKWIIIKINNLLVIKNYLISKIFTNFIDFSLRVQIID